MFFFVRHGQTDYSLRGGGIYRGRGADLCPLTMEGIEQIRATAKHLALREADLILSSPYTRAVQTAAILAGELGCPVIVETDLHEWEPDKTGAFLDDAAAEEACVEYITNRGRYPEGEERPWETGEAVRRRVLAVLEKYRSLDKVIVVGHRMMIQAVTNTRHPEFGQIVPFDLAQA